MHLVTCYLGLGSNLNEPAQQLVRAIQALSTMDDIKVIKSSSFYHSRPMGGEPRPDYVNAVVKIATHLLPEALLGLVKSLEVAHGRVLPAPRFASRPLDIDILLYGTLTMGTPHLSIPHVSLYERNFVLHPLFEIAPDLVFPDDSPISSRIAQHSFEGLTRFTAQEQELVCG